MSLLSFKLRIWLLFHSTCHSRRLHLQDFSVSIQPGMQTSRSGVPVHFIHPERAFIVKSAVTLFLSVSCVTKKSIHRTRESEWIIHSIRFYPLQIKSHPGG